MIDALVAISRRPAGAALALRPVEVVRQVLADHLPQFKSQQIRLVWHADPTAPPIAGHAHRLAAVVRHLLINACEALAAQRMNGGRTGTVSVECRRNADGNGVIIVIADDGPGFPPGLLATLADSEAVPAGIGKGCGLGLTVALGVTAEMGGALAITDNHPGTRVTLRLPTLHRSLLLVEDDAAAAAELAEALAARDWRVTVAHGGNPAWRLFRENGADAVVTDLHMPDGDGWRLIEQLRGDAPDLPIIAVSTAEGAEAQRAVNAGATLVIRKPVTARELARELEELQG